MKKTYTLIFAIVALIFAASCQRTAEVRLMSYNVRNCLGIDQLHSIDRVAEVINAAAPDAVAVQELDSMTARYPSLDILGELAARTGMHATYAPSIEFRGGKYGIGMLTREKPLSFRRVPLPCRSEPRSLLIVELPDYYYCCTHLSLHAEDRTTSAGIIIEQLSQLDKPLFIAGDFNAEPDEEAMRILSEKFEIYPKSGSHLTYPADTPEIEIDYIAHIRQEGVPTPRLLDHHVVDAPAQSDHRPIVATVQLRK